MLARLRRKPCSEFLVNIFLLTLYKDAGLVIRKDIMGNGK